MQGAKYKIVFSYLFILILCFGGVAHANGLVLRGAPALPDSFQNFPYANPRAPKGGELRLAEIGTFDSLLPWLIKGTAPPQLDWVYDKLMARSWDEPFTLYPLIAERVEQSADKKTLTFHLDSRARFQDGHAITAEDIEFSWQFLLKNGRPNTRRMFKMVSNVVKHDERTITFKFKPDADAEAPMIVAMMTVLPKHYWAPMGASATNTTLMPPVTSGPYQITRVDAGHTIVLSRDKNYWAADLPARRGQFNFDTVRVDYYRDDGVALQAFKSHAYDFRRETNPKRWVQNYHVPALQKENLSDGKPAPFRALVFNTRRRLFTDIRVRQALQLAFNFEWLNKNLFSNAYARAKSIYPKSVLADGTYHVATVDGSGADSQRKNLRRAQKLLSDAGWYIQNNELQNAAGEKFNFEILLNDPVDEKIALYFVRSLTRLGIVAKIRTLDSAQFAGRLEQFDFDMTVAQWVSTLSPGSEQAVYWGSRAAAQPGTRNYAGIADPAVDADIAALNAAPTTIDLIAAAHALDREIMNGAYFIPLYYAPADWVAYWPMRVTRPAQRSLYGTALETWWAKP